jgi:hypothetical protein
MVLRYKLIPNSSTNATEPSTFDMHWGDRPKRAAAVRLEITAADAPLISENINDDINTYWGDYRSDICDKFPRHIDGA